VETLDFLSYFKDTYFIMFHDKNKHEGVVDLKNHFEEVTIAQKNEQGYGVFFSVNQFPNSSRRAEFCGGINAWAIDIDDKDIPVHIQKLRIEKSPITPTFTVRSKNGYHLYWLAKDAKIGNYGKVVERLITWFDGDKQAKDISRVLRLPGTMHMKSEPFKVFVENFVDEVYTEEQMLAAFPEAVKAEPKKFWEAVGQLNNRYCLEVLSGKPEVKGEQFTFIDNSNGTKQIYVNGASSSSWIAEDGMIGSHDKGGPTIVQWLQWYGHNKAQIAKILKSYGLVKEENQTPQLPPQPPIKVSESEVAEPAEQDQTTKSDIEIIDNCYYLKKWDKDGDVTREKLTNFILRPINIYLEYGSFEHIREYQLINEAQHVAGPFKIHSGIFGSFTEFKKFCVGKGRFIYFGSDRSFAKVQNFILIHSEKFKKVNLIPRVGYVPKYKLWIFNNFAIHEGKIYQEDEKKIIWVNNEGFQSYNVSNSANDYSHSTLNLNKILDDMQAEVLFNSYVHKLCYSYGNHRIKIAISWMIANVFSFDVFNKFHIFPFLFIHGKTRSGKDVLSSWLVSLFGLDHSIKESLPQMNSTVGINRKSAYYSSMPIVLDEYRNNHKISDRFDGFFKNLATRTGVTKGSKITGEMRTEPIYSNFIFTSEELPQEPAIVNRSVVIRLNPNERDDSIYDEILAQVEEFFQIGIYMIKRSAFAKDTFFKNIAILKDKLTGAGVNPYNAEAYAIAGAGYVTFFPHDDSFIETLLSEAKDSNDKKESHDKLAQFWSDMETIYAMKDFKGVDVVKRGNNGEVYIWLKIMCDKWNEFRKKSDQSLYGYFDLLELMKESKGFVEYNKPVRIGDHVRKCLAFKESEVSQSFSDFLNGYFKEEVDTLAF